MKVELSATRVESRLLQITCFLLFGFTPSLLMALPYQQDAGTGLVAFEAEHSDATVARSGFSWVSNFTAGYSADSGLRTSPTSGTAQKDPGYSQTSPQLDYQVNFVQTGTHYVWVRGIGSTSGNNSVHVGLDGNEVATSQALSFPVGSNWVWHGGVGVASFDVGSLGVHTVNVWMREAGFRIDKLVVTTDAGFVPSGTGPQESQRGSGGGGANQIPVAVAGGPYNGLTGNPVSFDGSGSFDLDGDALTYSWDFGDGSALGSGVTPTHSYTTAGSYTVTLTVNDGTENSLAATATVTVVDDAGPAAYQQDAGTGLVAFEAEHSDATVARSGFSWVSNFTAGYSADSGLRTSPTSGTAQKDPGYSQTSPQLDYQVNFVQTGTHYVWVRGIGSTSGNNSVHVGLDGNEVATSQALSFPVGSNWIWHGGVGVASFDVGSLGVHTVNVWMREAGFRIDKLVVTTDAGFVPSGTGPQESPRSGGGGNQAPVAVAGGPYSGLAGSPIGFDGSGSSDLDGDVLTYSWDFGDGSALGSGVTPTHSYATAGGYTVTLTVNDGTENSTASTANVTVNPAGGGNQAPVAVAGGPYNGLTGSPIGFDGSGSSDLDGDALTYSWDFGDGSALGSGVTPTHSYATAGGYTVTLTVNDGTENSLAATATVTVTDGAGPAAYQQDAGTGLVAFEAEHSDATIARSGFGWVSNFTAGYSADSGLRTSPTSGTAQKDPGYSQTSPQLDYQVNFVQTGTHYVWVRGIGSTSGNNSVHVGLDGNEVATSQALSFPVGSNWIWHGGVGVASFDVGSLGVHTVNVWMREAGFRIDKLVVTTDAGFVPSGTGPQESPRSGGGGNALFEDNFNDGNALGWSAVDECVKGSSNWSVVNNLFIQSGECRGFSPEGVAIASHVVSDVSLPANVDIQLRLSSQDPATDATPVNDSSRWEFDTLGILFAYQDANNHYRFELDGMKGHRKLWRKQAGVYTELNTSPQSFVRGQWHDLRVVHQNDVILIFIDGQQVMAVEDATFNSGPMALFCARNPSCNFDDISVVDAPVDPMIGLMVSPGVGHAFSEYFVDTDDVLDVSAATTIGAAIGGIEFVIDEGTAGELSQTDLVAPYTAQFGLLSAGDHTVTGYLVNGTADRLVTPGAAATLAQIGTGGIHLYAIGDSITNGIDDDLTTDDISPDGRNTGGGYAPILNSFLSADNGIPVTVLNDGNPGEESSEGAARIDEILVRTPEVQAYLVFYGANDSGGSLPRASGLDLSSGEAGYAGSFKDYIQQLIDAVLAESKLIILAKAPPYLANSTRNDLVIQYNQVIDQLILENTLGYVPPDHYGYFIVNQSEFAADGIHPAGVGYQSMARIWCQGLNGILGLTCIP